VLACVALLVLFDFTNGFHDTANMVASVIACRAMTPTQTIPLASLFTFLRPLLGGTAVGGFVTLDTLPTGCWRGSRYRVRPVACRHGSLPARPA